MREDRGIFLMEKYRIRNGVFQGVIITREPGHTIQDVCLWNQQTDVTCKTASAFAMGKKGECEFLVKITDKAYMDGSWSILVTSNQGEYQVDFPVPQSEREFGKMLSLKQTEVLPGLRMHIIPAVSKSGFFALGKWHNKEAAVDKSPAYISAIKEGEDSLQFSCKKWLDQDVRQAELLLWSRELKQMIRLTLESDDLIRGNVSAYLANFIQTEVEDEVVGKDWKMYFHANIDGKYYLSPLEHFKNKKTALNQPTERPITYNETSYYFGPFESEINTRINPEGKIVWSVFYDRMGQLRICAIERSRFYIPQYREKIENLRIEQGICTVKILCAESEFEYEALVLRSRLEPDNEDKNYRFELESEKELADGKRMVWKRKLEGVEFEPYLDFILYGKKDGVRYEITPTNLTNSKKFTHPKMDNFYTNDEGWYVFPYVTEDSEVVLYCREKDERDGRFTRFREWVAECIFRVFHNYFEHHSITVMYENNCTQAQDNAYYMFDYIMSREDISEEIKRDLYYIIDKRQPDYERLRPYKRHVLNFMSIRHMVYLLGAKQYISTDSKENAFHLKARPCQILDQMSEARWVFLQHGVLGLKKVDKIYGNDGGRGADLVMASSAEEKRLLVKKFGYEPDSVAVTGLARWDVLKDHSAGMRNILVMPTWRTWLEDVDQDTFAKSEFCRVYREFLQSQMLAEVLETKSMTLTFVLHPKMKQYMDLFEVQTERITLYDYETRPINELIMTCSMFMTDYSSVAWDAYYLGKPVVFYQFDRTQYEKEQGSYLNLDTQLFGDQVTGVKDLFQAILTYEYNDFRERPENAARRKAYIPLQEDNHRELVYEAIKPGLVDLEI